MGAPEFLVSLPETWPFVGQPFEVFDPDQHSHRLAPPGQLHLGPLLYFMDHAGEIISGFRDRVCLDHLGLLMAI
jgi:hypothetical protein